MVGDTRRDKREVGKDPNLVLSMFITKMMNSEKGEYMGEKYNEFINHLSKDGNNFVLSKSGQE
jgi:hypothetical protein